MSKRITLFVALALTAINITPAHASRECMATVIKTADQYQSVNFKFEVTEKTINTETSEVLIAGHGTDWYKAENLRLSGYCHFIKLPRKMQLLLEGDDGKLIWFDTIP